MSDLKERLKSHADWLDSNGEAKTQAHVNPETCRQAAKDIREAINNIEDLEAQPEPGLDCGYRSHWTDDRGNTFDKRDYVMRPREH